MIQFGNGAEDEGSEGENDYMEVSDEEDEDRQAGNSDDDDDIVRTQEDGLLPLNNGFIGLAFVHHLTRTNILLGSMNYKGMIVERQVIYEAGNLKRA